MGLFSFTLWSNMRSQSCQNKNKIMRFHYLFIYFCFKKFISKIHTLKLGAVGWPSIIHDWVEVTEYMIVSVKSIVINIMVKYEIFKFDMSQDERNMRNHLYWAKGKYRWVWTSYAQPHICYTIISFSSLCFPSSWSFFFPSLLHSTRHATRPLLLGRLSSQRVN
jgi:hypothetical protein